MNRKTDRGSETLLKVGENLNSIKLCKPQQLKLMLYAALLNEMNINGLQTGEYIALVVQNYEYIVCM